MADPPRIPVRVRGSIRGYVVDADGTVRLFEDVVAIHVGEREHAMRLDRLDGVVWESPVLAMHVASEVVELSGHAGLEPLGTRIVTAALALPELTRTMQGLGTRKGRAGADHDRFFAALLTARRAAEGFVEPDSRLAAFDARRLAQALTTLIGELANERYPESAPDRRALEAELQEYAERLYGALETLGAAAEAVRTSPNATRLARWRDWTWSVQRVFEEADRCWIASLPSLTAPPATRRRRRFWRRV